MLINVILAAVVRVQNSKETISYIRLLSESFERWTGRNMLAELGGSPADDFAAAVSRAPCPLVSHGTEADPIFRYANDAALSLWETDWDTFTSMPSRLSAAPVTDIQDDRSKLLKEALAKGWVDNYSGVRVSRGGKSFMIKDTALWNVVDEAGVRHGQAALIKSWSPV